MNFILGCLTDLFITVKYYLVLLKMIRLAMRQGYGIGVGGSCLSVEQGWMDPCKNDQSLVLTDQYLIFHFKIRQFKRIKI